MIVAMLNKCSGSGVLKYAKSKCLHAADPLNRYPQSSTVNTYANNKQKCSRVMYIFHWQPSDDENKTCCKRKRPMIRDDVT